MGFYTEFIFIHEGVEYNTCDRDGFETFADKNIEKLINDLSLYRNYIKNMLSFLNIDRSDEESMWPHWSLGAISNTQYCGDNMYWMALDQDCLEVDGRIYDLTVHQDRKKPPEFIAFLNRRFYCDKIWKQYKLPKDIINYIQDNFF